MFWALVQDPLQPKKGFYRKNLTPKDARIFAPQNFSPWRKIPKIPKSRITQTVTSNSGHPLHHHLRHSSRLSNSLFNRRTAKFQTFTQWLQASTLLFTPQWPYRPFIITPADRVQSDLTLYVLGLSITRLNTTKNNEGWHVALVANGHPIFFSSSEKK